MKIQQRSISFHLQELTFLDDSARNSLVGIKHVEVQIARNRGIEFFYINSERDSTPLLKQDLRRTMTIEWFPAAIIVLTLLVLINRTQLINPRFQGDTLPLPFNPTRKDKGAHCPCPC